MFEAWPELFQRPASLQNDIQPPGKREAGEPLPFLDLADQGATVMSPLSDRGLRQLAQRSPVPQLRTEKNAAPTPAESALAVPAPRRIASQHHVTLPYPITEQRGTTTYRECRVRTVTLSEPNPWPDGRSPSIVDTE